MSKRATCRRERKNGALHAFFITRQHCMFSLLLALPFASPLASAPPPLPRLRIAADGVSVSGLSSGADFVVQLQVAFSSVVRGVGVFAGQPYHCAVHRFPGEVTVPPCWGTHEDGSHPGCTNSTPAPNVPFCENCPAGRTLLYDHCKGHPEVVNVSELLSYAREQAALGTIDPLESLAGTPVYFYRGTKDATYRHGSL